LTKGQITAASDESTLRIALNNRKLGLWLFNEQANFPKREDFWQADSHRIPRQKPVAELHLAL